MQLQLGSLVITADPTLQREGFRLITVGQRVVKCLKELVLGMLTFTHPSIDFLSKAPNFYASRCFLRRPETTFILIPSDISAHAFSELSNGTDFLDAEARVKDVLVNIPDTRIRNAKLSRGFLH